MTCGDATYPVQIVGKHGRPVRWRAASYKDHVNRRPYLADHRALEHAVRNPLVEREAPGGQWHYYASPGLLPHPYAPLYLFVAVWWRQGIGDIATAFVVKKVRAY